MAGYSAVDPTAKDAESPINVDLIEKLDQNPLAMFEGAAGAPKIQNAAFNDNTINASKLIDNTVGQNKIGANAVGAGEIKVGIATNTQTLTGIGDLVGTFTTKPSPYFDLGNTIACFEQVGANNDISFFGIKENEIDVASAPVADIAVFRPYCRITSTARNAVITSKFSYIQASPPIDLGDGEMAFFTYLHIKGGEVIGVMSSEVPPWLYAGPTSVTPTAKGNGGVKMQRVKTANRETGEVTESLIEIDQSVKNADMPLIPHPFLSTDSSDSIALLDPMNAQCLMDLHEAGEDIASLIRDDYIKFDNIALNRAAIPGVMQVDFRWKNTNKKPMGMKKNKKA